MKRFILTAAPGLAFSLVVLFCGLAVPPTAEAAEVADTIIIPHSLHFEAEVECATCHEGVAESSGTGDTIFPEMDVCGDCHDIDDDENCAMCHTNLDNAGEYHRGTFGASRFSHALHADGGLDCSTCHGDPASAQPVLPGKPDCRHCHETADNYADCGLCHSSDFSLRPTDHDPA